MKSGRSVVRLCPGSLVLLCCGLALTSRLAGGEAGSSPVSPRRTVVSIVGDEFHLNGRPAYAGRTWRGHKIQGLLLNSRMVQGIFDDRNPETVRC